MTSLIFDPEKQEKYKKLYPKYLDFLQSAISQKAEIVHVKVLSKTRSGYGFNLKKIGGEQKYYLHTSGRPDFYEGQTLLITCRESKRLAGRLDVDNKVAIESIQVFIDVLWKSDESIKLITGTSLKQNAFDHDIVDRAQRCALLNFSSIPKFFESYRESLRQLYLKLASPECVPELINYGVPESKVLDFLLKFHSKSTPQKFSELKGQLEEKSYVNAIAVIDLLCGKFSNTALEVITNLLVKSEHTEGVASFISCIWRKNSEKSQIAEALSNITSLEPVLVRLVLEKLPDTGEMIQEYLSPFPYVLRLRIVGELDSKFTPWLIHLGLPERSVCEYLSINLRKIHSTEIELIKSECNSVIYMQALLLCELIENWHRGKRLSAQMISMHLANWCKVVFKAHSEKRLAIENIIFLDCSPATIIRSKRRKFQLCEGKCWYSDRESNERELLVLCRRLKCTQNYLLNNNLGYTLDDKTTSKAYFYQLVLELFNVNKVQLHQIEMFSRTLAALNRWNEVLDRLHCGTCKKPLTLSEHAKGSMGKMAIGASYWHCDNAKCLDYCKTVKITYCIGCQKVIDSRTDTHACEPNELKAFKKFYICTDCGSCCTNHSGASGRCPNCGISHAFSNVTEANRTRAECRNCRHTVSFDKLSFGNLAQARNDTSKRSGRISNEPSSLVFPPQLKSYNNDGITIIDLPWNESALYIYDIFGCLNSGGITLKQLSDYAEIYDLKIIDRMIHLGLYHKNYTGNQEHSTQLETLLKEANSGRLNANEHKDLIISEMNRLFNQMAEEYLWDHYYKIELPFVFSLHSLIGNGFNIHAGVVSDVIAKASFARSTVVEKLRNIGVDNPDRETLQEYIEQNFSGRDKFAMISALMRRDFKQFRDTVPTFNLLYKIDKIERIAKDINVLAGYRGNIKPDYQILGAETGRCTSRSPNLMGIPKELRPIVTASAGCGIVECDYSQMEIGVLAALSGDCHLISDFNSGDVYQSFATKINTNREQAKSLFLAIIYGVSTNTLAVWLSIDTKQAKSLHDSFFHFYPAAREFLDSQVKAGLAQGYVQTVTRLRRRINHQPTDSSNNALEYWQQNWLRNYPVQANAAIVFKRAIIDISENIQDRSFKLIVPHYDAIVFEASLTQLEYHTQLVCAAMKRAMKNYFPELEPHIKVNNHDVTCWNGGSGVLRYDQWLTDIVEEMRHASV